MRDRHAYARTRVRNLTVRIRYFEAYPRPNEGTKRRLRLDKLARKRWLKEFPDLVSLC